MSFILRNLAPIGGQASRGKAPQMFGYRTDDAATAVDAAGYFDAASDILDIGDIIMVTTVDDVTTPTSVTSYGTHIVLSNAAGVVDVSNATAGTMTDSD